MSMTSHDSETPAHGRQVITACAFIHKNFDGVEKVFLAKRAATKKFLPHVFELPGGHIDFGEDVMAGLKREIMEELQVEITVGDPFFVFTYINAIKGSHSIEVGYFATLVGPIKNIRLHAEDHSEYRWMAENEVDEISSSVSDEELRNIKKGFALLRGKPPSFS